MFESRIAIAGGGVAGLKTALELNNIGFKTTLIEPQKTIEEEELPAITYSTPLIFDIVAKEYGIDLDQDSRIDRFESSALTIRRRAFVLLLSSYLHFFNHYLYAPSIYDIRNHLRSNVDDCPNINLIKGKVTDIAMDGKKAVGVEIDNKDILETDLIIDASGRNAIVSKKISEKDKNLVRETKTPQPTTVLGSYVSILPEVTDNNLPHVRNTMYSEQLPNNLEFIFIPAAAKKDTNSSPAINNRFLTIVQGNRCKIEKAYSEHSGDIAERRHEVIKSLVVGSRWEPIMQASTQPHETILYKYSEAIRRDIKADNAVSVGDARMNVSPVAGTGLLFLNHDVKTLLESIKKHSYDMHRAAASYNKSQMVPSLLKWIFCKNKYANSYSAKIMNK